MNYAFDCLSGVSPISNHLAHEPILSSRRCHSEKVVYTGVGISKKQVPSCPMGIGYSKTPYIEIATPPAAARNDTSAKQEFIVPLAR